MGINPLQNAPILAGIGETEQGLKGKLLLFKNLCTWRPNTVYKNRSVRRHQAIFWRRCRGGKETTAHRTPSSTQRHKAIFWCRCQRGERLKVFSLDSAILSFCFWCPGGPP